MKSVILSLIILVSAHTIALVAYNRYRIKKFIDYITTARGEYLSEKEYSSLLDLYTSFFSYAQPPPDKIMYEKLYLMKGFAKFAKSSSFIFKYLAFFVISGYIVLAILNEMFPL